MFQKLFDAVQGYKTYILAAVGIIVALIGHFWGPITLTGGTTIPALSWNDVWQTIWGSGIVASLRHGISTSSTTPSA